MMGWCTRRGLIGVGLSGRIKNQVILKWSEKVGLMEDKEEGGI